MRKGVIVIAEHRVRFMIVTGIAVLLLGLLAAVVAAGANGPTSHPGMHAILAAGGGLHIDE
jgi:hypothetical protein